MAIAWREQLAVGNTDIDDDHKYLICMINAVDVAMKSDAGPDVVEIFLTQLIKYTEDHFTREEAIQQKVGYPHAIQHRNEHRELANQLRGLHKEIGMQPDAASREEKLKDLVAFLRHWLIDHIIKSDKQMTPFLPPKGDVPI